MAATAGYNATVKITGTSTAMTEEPCSLVSSGATEVWRVISTSKRILDPAVAISVYDATIPPPAEVPATAYTVDYLTGTITITSGTYIGLISSLTVTANFLPTMSAGALRSATVTSGRDELDTSVLGTVEKSLILGKRQATVEAESLSLLSEDLDSGAGSMVLDTLQDNATPKLIEVVAGGRTFRGWGLFPSLSKAIPQDGVISSSLTFRTIARTATGRSEIVAYSYSE